MTTTLSGIAEELERRIEAFHDGLPQGQGETGDGGKAGKELCQWVYDNAETLATLIRTADDREKVLREALKPFARMATAFDYWCEDVMPSLRYPINGADEEMAISDGVPDAVGCLTEQDFQRARQALGGTNA